MHEYSIACEIWQSVLKAVNAQFADQPDIKPIIRAVTVEIGALNLIETEQLSFWLEQLAAREGSPGLELKLKMLPGRVKCRECGIESVLEEKEENIWLAPLHFLDCPNCGSRNVAVLGGRELRVVSAELDQEVYNGNRE